MWLNLDNRLLKFKARISCRDNIVVFVTNSLINYDLTHVIVDV